MKQYEIKNKIVEVHAAARIIVQKYGHGRKFAKHLVAFAIRQYENFSSDEKLSEFLGKDPIGKILGYKKSPHISTFSKVRKRSDPKMFEDLHDWFIRDRFRGKQLLLVAQDSTAVSAFSENDKDAATGVRTIPKNRQQTKEHVEYFFGYKIHMIAEVKEEIPIGISIEPGNTHDVKLFQKLFRRARDFIGFGFGAKYLSDSALDSTDVKEELRGNFVTPVIARNGRAHRTSEIPKDPDYGRRWAIERIFSRLKEVFGLAKNRFVGIRKFTIHVFSCLLAYLIKYVM
jgi:hypothetical protein